MAIYFSSVKAGETLFPAVRATFFSPIELFRGMPRADGYRSSLVLLSIFLAIPALIVSLMSGFIMTVIILPLYFIFGLGGTWLWAWYLGWAARRFCSVDLDTAGAFQICAYSSAPIIFSWVPVIGLIASFWGIYLNWQGLVSHAKVGGGAAVLMILIPLLALMLSLFVLAILLTFWLVQMGIDPETLSPPIQFF